MLACSLRGRARGGSSASGVGSAGHDSLIDAKVLQDEVRVIDDEAAEEEGTKQRNELSEGKGGDLRGEQRASKGRVRALTALWILPAADTAGHPCNADTAMLLWRGGVPWCGTRLG